MAFTKIRKTTLMMLVALCAVAQATIQFKAEFLNPVVAGVNKQSTIAVSIKNDTSASDTLNGLNSLAFTIILPENVSATEEGLAKVGPLKDNANDKTDSVVFGSMVSLNAGPDMDHQAAKLFDIPSDWVRIFEVPVTFNAEKLNAEDVFQFALEIASVTVSDGVVSDSVDAQIDQTEGAEGVLSLTVLDSFNFGVAKGATFESDENTALAVSAADSRFEALAWNGTTLVATKAVEFTEAKTDEASASNGTVSVENGVIKVEPKDLDRLAAGETAEVLVDYTVKSTELTGVTKKGNFTVTFTGVDDAPVVTLDSIVTAAEAIKEGAAFAVKVTVEDVDTEITAVSFTTYKVVVGDETYDAVAREATDVTPNAFSTVLDVAALSYDLIAGQPRPETATYPVKVTFKAADEKTYVSNVIDDVTFTDVDRDPVSNNDPAVAIPEGPYTTESETEIADANFSDADGDEIELWYYWTREGDFTDGNLTIYSGATISSIASKGDTWTPHIKVTTKPYGQAVEKIFDGEAITIVDTPAAIVGGADSLYIQKGGEKLFDEGNVVIADPDADDGVDQHTADEFSLSASAEGKVSLEKDKYDPINKTFTYKVTIKATEQEIKPEDNFSITITLTDAISGKVTKKSVPLVYMADPVPIFVASTDPKDAKEGEKIVASVTVKDGKIEGAPAPSGIASVEWTLALAEKVPGAAPIIQVPVDPKFKPTKGEDEATSTVTIDLDFKVLDGADRVASAKYILTATAKDGKHGAANSKSWTITISDVDRKPTVNKVNVNVTDGPYTTGKDIAFTVSGAEDPDGDAIAGYEVNGKDAKLAPISAETLLGRKVAKGDKISLSVKAYSAPKYASETSMMSEATSEDQFKELVTIINSTPTGESKDAIVQDEATRTDVMSYAISDFATIEDIDAIRVAGEEKDRDSLSYALVQPTDVEGYGSLSYNKETGKIEYTPALYFNGTIPFGIKATDESGEEITVQVALNITAVNDAPVIVKQDIYNIPTDFETPGQETTFKVLMGGDEKNTWEADQLLESVTLTEVSNAIRLTNVKAKVAADGQSVLFSYTLPEYSDALLGQESVFQLVVTDKAGVEFGKDSATSEPVTFKVVIGATPWYPTVEASDFGNKLHDGNSYMVDIVDAKEQKVVTTLKIIHDTIKAEDYLDYTDGLQAGTYTYKAYAWSPSEGRDAEPIAEATVMVDPYDSAAKPTLSVNEVEGNPYARDLSISAPMASKYRLAVAKDGGNPVYSWGRFTAGEDGVIRSEVILRKSFYEPGTYTLTVCGWNPSMENVLPEDYVESESKEVVIAAEDIDDNKLPEFAATTDEAYRPKDNKNIWQNASGIHVVDFAWPGVAVNAQYKLYVYTINGRLVGDGKPIDCGANTVASVSLELKNNMTMYMWRVSADVPLKDGNTKTIWSQSMTFKLSVQSQLPLTNGVSLVPGSTNQLSVSYDSFNGQKLPEGTSFEFMGFDVESNTWVSKEIITVSGTDIDNTTPGTAKLTLPEDVMSKIGVGDYVYLRAILGDKIGAFEDFVLK